MRHPLHWLVIVLALSLSACATSQNHYDPIEPVNRVTDKINDGVDRVTLKPLAKGYTTVVPKPMRSAVSNFYDNSTYMNTVLNDFLQGKGKQGFMDLMRFLINTTLGIGGLVDVATPMGFERHDEDFGQTLATWGVGQGAYIVYPFVGPNSVRNTPDFLTATATDPLFWAGLTLAPYVTIPFTVLKYIDKRARLLSASDMRDELALDPYVFTREAWRQQREYLIYDGHPPAKQNNEDDFESDDFDAPETETVPADATTGSSADSAGSAAQPKTRIRIDDAPAAAAPAEPAPAAAPQSRDDQSGSKRYLLFLSSHATEVEAAAEQAHIARLGIDSEIVPARLNGRVWYRLQQGSYADKQAAQQALKRFRNINDLGSAWLEMEQQ